MKKIFFIFSIWFVFFCVAPCFGERMTVIYPKPASSADTRFLYEIELLKAALEHTKGDYGDYLLKPAARVMNELRYVEEARKGISINVIWRGVTKDLETRLIPIRIPVLKGLLGYRIFLIRKDREKEFTKISTLDELKKYKVGQGRDWGDVAVFKANSIPVVTATCYECLFAMLSANRFDYFSRGITEAFKEIKERKTKYPDLIVEKNLMLYYPWPYYYYVSPKYPNIAKRLAKGLKRMIRDGTFDKIFFEYNKESIIKANVKKRKLIKIKNPYLPKTVPLAQKELWFNPYNYSLNSGLSGKDTLP